MSLLPSWQSKYPTERRRASDFFHLGRFFEELEHDLEALRANNSGLSISSDDKSVYVEAHVPGLTAKDVDVSIDSNNFLWIKGEIKTEDQNKKRKYYRQSQVSFSYCIPLWEEIDTKAEPEAVCKDGVMKLTFAKKESQAEAKKIQVKE